MVKVVGYLVALGVLVAGLLAPAWVLWDDDAAVAAARVGVEDLEPTTIVDYDATFELRTGGDLLVEEQVTVEFPPYADRTGITRYFDRVDGSDERARRRVHDLSVTLDGEPATVDLSVAAHGRFDVATIGDPDVVVEPGEHRYVIRYLVSHPLEPGYGDSPASLHWDLVPSTWQQEIEQAELTVRLPAPARDVQCGIGGGAAPPACGDVTGQDTDTLVVRTGPLPAHTPVRVRLGVAAPRTDGGSQLLWRPQYDVVLGQSLPVLGLVLGGSLVTGVLGLLLARRARRSDPRPTPTDEPPAALGPAQAAYVLTGRTERLHYVASLVHAGQHGAVDVTRRGSGWVVAERSGPQGWAGLDPVTSHVADLLDVPGRSVTVDAASAASGERLAAEIASFGARIREWGRAAGLVETVRPSQLPAVLVLTAVAATAAAIVWNPFDMSITGLVPGLFAVGVLPWVSPVPTTRPTPAGRALRSAVAGFERTLCATSEAERFDFTGREDRYAAYLPWAVALGRADEWAAAYRGGTGHEPPAVPSASVVAELDASIAGAVASYEDARDSAGEAGHRRGRTSRRARSSAPR